MDSIRISKSKVRFVRKRKTMRERTWTSPLTSPPTRLCVQSWDWCLRAVSSQIDYYHRYQTCFACFSSIVVTRVDRTLWQMVVSSSKGKRVDRSSSYLGASA